MVGWTIHFHYLEMHEQGSLLREALDQKVDQDAHLGWQESSARVDRIDRMLPRIPVRQQGDQQLLLDGVIHNVVWLADDAQPCNRRIH